MLCKVDGCERIADYKSACLCQKHYFRYRRNGDFEIHKKARPRIEDDRGYQFVHDPIHPLTARGQIYIAESSIILRIRSGWEPHRAVYQESRLAKRRRPDDLIQITHKYRAKAREIERGE